MKLDAASLSAYDERIELLSDLGLVAEGLIKELVRAAGIQPHSVTHRVKSKRSFRRKLTEKGASYATIEDIHDLLGVRVITYFPDEVDAVAQVIEDEFAVDDDNSVDKRALLDPDRFGYLSVHYVCELDQTRRGLTEHKRFAGLKLEVQIRSVLQHAWAEIEHDLGYHTEGALPRDVRRRFSQLAGVLEMADQGFGEIRQELAVYKKAVEKDPITNAGIDRDSLLAFMRSNPLVKELDQHLARNFNGLEEATPEFAGVIAEELQIAGLTTMAELAQALADRRAVVRRFVDSWFADGHHDAQAAAKEGLSVFYLWYVLLAERFDQPRLVDVIRDRNLGPETPARIAEDVRAAYDAARTPS
jgi:ppGpp synthetase/RelA/SpoT-type nucleotidyltranferase